jgi:hypothetical protein
MGTRHLYWILTDLLNGKGNVRLDSGNPITVIGSGSFQRLEFLLHLGMFLSRYSNTIYFILDLRAIPYRKESILHKRQAKFFNPLKFNTLPALVAQTGTGGAVCKGATPSVEPPGGHGFKPRLRSLLD